MRSRRLLFSCLALSSSLAFLVFAADKPAATPQRETVAKPLTAKQKRDREAKLKKELETPYKKWLNEDVVYIITDEEKQAWKRLATDEEREQFIEQFWLRRDPSPDSVENEFKEEHYRRIAYANERFASGIQGWRTDRGRIYITFGPPDENENHTSGGQYQRPVEEGGGLTSTYPFEIWRYRYIEGIGSDIQIEFVDKTMSGEFRMTMDPSEKDALLYVPNAGLTMYEEMGVTSKADRFTRSDGTRLGVPQDAGSYRMNPFNRLEQYAKLQKPPVVKFKDLEASVNSTIKFNVLPFQVHADYFPLTESSVLTNITMQLENKDLQFQAKDNVQKASVNIYLRISTMTRRTVTWNEETVAIDSPTEYLSEQTKRSSIYWKSFPLPPGRYRLNIVAKDTVGGNMNNFEMVLEVPHTDAEKLATSSLVLADLIEKVPSTSIGSGLFVLGSTKVRPRINNTFRRDEKMGIYMKAYNFGPDEKQKPEGDVQYEIVKAGSSEKILEHTQAVSSIPGASTSQVVIEQLLPLKNMEPGKYTLKIKVTDSVKKQSLTPAVDFTVN